MLSWTGSGYYLKHPFHKDTICVKKCQASQKRPVKAALLKSRWLQGKFHSPRAFDHTAGKKAGPRLCTWGTAPVGQLLPSWVFFWVFYEMMILHVIIKIILKSVVGNAECWVKVIIIQNRANIFVFGLCSQLWRKSSETRKANRSYSSLSLVFFPLPPLQRKFFLFSYLPRTLSSLVLMHVSFLSDHSKILFLKK